jgi:hypothetical protein
LFRFQRKPPPPPPTRKIVLSQRPCSVPDIGPMPGLAEGYRQLGKRPSEREYRVRSTISFFRGSLARWNVAVSYIIGMVWL